MAMRENVVVFLALWVVLSALLAPSVEVFLTVAFIGILITLEIGDFYLENETKESLKFSTYFLLVVFAIMMIKRAYNIIMLIL